MNQSKVCIIYNYIRKEIHFSNINDLTWQNFVYNNQCDITY